MHCKNCDNVIEEGTLFCKNCRMEVIRESASPTKKYELIIKIVNCVLMSIYGYLSMMISGLGIILLLIIGIISTKNPDINFETAFGTFFDVKVVAWFIVSVIIFIFNIIMGILMNKKNKNTITVSKFKKIKKTTYILLTFFLGMYGVHRFAIGDKKGGLIRLGIIFGGTIIIIRICEFMITSIFFILVPSFINFGLVLSDFVIGLSKISDENKMIAI